LPKALGALGVSLLLLGLPNSTDLTLGYVVGTSIGIKFSPGFV